MPGWGASLHASGENSPEIFQLVKKGKRAKRGKIIGFGDGFRRMRASFSHLPQI
jgi:hypothetical protein